MAAQSVGDWAGKQRVLGSSLMQTNMEGVLIAGTRTASEHCLHTLVTGCNLAVPQHPPDDHAKGNGSQGKKKKFPAY